MKKVNYYKIFLIVIFLISVAIIGFFIKLPRTERLKANTLLIEGWISDDALDFAYNEFKKEGYQYIITTGLKLPDYYILSRNGLLVFYPDFKQGNVNINNNHIIELHLYSDLGGEDKAHANLFINNNKIDSFYVEERKRGYFATWYGCLAEIDSIIIQYDNNAMGKTGDRNLWVKNIVIDDAITLPYYYSVHEVYRLKGNYRIKNNNYSYAEEAKNKLIALGIDSSKIFAIPGDSSIFLRTLKSAIECNDWIKNTDISINGINVISQGIHTKRTFFTYRKIFNNSINIGIIEAPDKKSKSSRLHTFFKTTKEVFGFLLYSIVIFLFY